MADDTTTSVSYRLWTGRTGDPAIVITGHDLRFDGTLGRGYLTRPPIVCRRDGGEVAFQFGGNRRVAPSPWKQLVRHWRCSKQNWCQVSSITDLGS